VTGRFPPLPPLVAADPTSQNSSTSTSTSTSSSSSSSTDDCPDCMPKMQLCKDNVLCLAALAQLKTYINQTLGDDPKKYIFLLSFASLAQLLHFSRLRRIADATLHALPRSNRRSRRR
jgi:hypothetical protein